MSRTLGLASFFSISLFLFHVSCDSIKTNLDRSGLDEVAQTIMRDFYPAAPGVLSDYIAAIDIVSDTRVMPSDTIGISELKTWLLSPEKTDNFIQELLEFPSCLMKSDGKQDTAIFHVYRYGSLSGQKAIIWIPGFGVSDFAFQFIRKFFYAAIDHGYAVVFYNIPHHLYRIAKGKKAGEGFITSDISKNIELFRSCLCEIRTVIAFLRERGIASISGWGGSVGAALIWLTSTSIRMDHMTLMIPIVDWRSVVFGPSFAAVIESYERAGYTGELIVRAYGKISPIGYESLTPGERVQILYGRADQLTPEETILGFASSRRITNVSGYDESHSSILCNERMYADYSRFLDKMSGGA